MTPRADALEVEGGSLRLWRWPSRPGRPKLHFAHATGFHARTYLPLFERLAGMFELIAWDMRGHGESGALGRRKTFLGWESYYRDLTALIDAEGPLFLAGHSVGATTSLIAAGRRPDAVRGLLLIDPVLLGPYSRFLLGVIRMLGIGERFHLARLAARRRPGFADRDAMFRAYHGRGPFRSWPDEWLRAYVEYGVVDTTDGVRLACDPAFESLSFSRTEFRPWQQTGSLACPMSVLVGQSDSTCGTASRRQLEDRYPQVRVRELPGTTHFVPMERLEAVAAALRELVRA